MSNLSSRSVKKRTTLQLNPYIGSPPIAHSSGAKWIDMSLLRKSIKNGIEEYVWQIFNDNVMSSPTCTLTHKEFFKRYSSIISDRRITVDGITTNMIGGPVALGNDSRQIRHKVKRQMRIYWGNFLKFLDLWKL